MAQANIKAVITAEDRASAALKGFGSNVQSIGHKVAGAMKLAAAAAVAATTALGVFAINQFRDIQKNVAGVRALTKNTDEARKALKNAIDFVQGKPFDRLDTIGATKQLLAFGRSTKQIQADLKTLGNTVLISGIDWQNLTRVYGRVVASGKLLREDFNILNDAGVGLAQTLQKELGTNMAGVFKQMEQGKITAEQFQNALKKAAPDSVVQASLNTFDNKLLSLKSKLRDLAFGILGVDFNQLSEEGEPLVKEGGLLDRLTDGIDSLTNFLKGLNGEFSKLGGAFRAIQGLATNLGEGGLKFLATAFNFLRPAVNSLWNSVKGQLIPALKQLWKDVLEPLMPIIGGIAVAAVLLFVAALKVAIHIIISMAKALSSVARSIRTVISWISSIVDRLKSGGGAWKTFKDAAMINIRPIVSIVKTTISLIEKLIQKIGSATGAVKNLSGAGGISGKRSLLNPFGIKVPGFQHGTNFAPGGAAIVGERGAELVNLPRGSQVTPINKVSKAPQISLNINIGMYAGTEIEKRRVAQELLDAMKDIASRKNITLSEMIS